MSARISAALATTVAIFALTASHRPAAAQSDQPAASAGGLEEIVVTARRREERLQTVPIAITAFTQAQLEQKHVEQLRDLSKVVPSLAISQTLSDPNAFFSGQVRLRGLAGTEIYFADVPLSSTDSNPATGLTHGLSPGFFYDNDTTEVDKGAQGTLFGRPSIGGLISIQPKRPTNNLEGYLQTTFGNYGDKEVEGAVNIPIVQDKLMVRIAGQMQKRDGYTLNLQDGSYLDDRDYYAWRVGVTLRPTDDFENYLLYDGYWQDSHGASNMLAKIDPKFPLTGYGFVKPGVLGPVPLLVNGKPNPACLATVTLSASGAGSVPGGCGGAYFGVFPTLPDLLAQQQALGPRTILGRPSSEIGKDYFYGFTDIATWDITDTLSLKNIAAARVFKQLSVDDFSSIGLPLAIFGFPGNNHGWNNNEVQYTEELQLSGKALNDRLDWRVGGFLLFDHPLGDTTIVLDGLGSTIYNHYSESSRSQAVFAHAIYDLSDWVPNLRFTAGYRYTWDFDSLSEQSTTPNDGVTRDPSGIATNCNVPLHDNNCRSQVNGNFSSFGWNLGLDYQFTPQTMVYVRAGNAYRPGGSILAVPAPYNKYQPEHVTDVELGVKTDYEVMGVHGRTNADIYHTDYKAIQVSIVQTIPSQVPGGVPSVASITANAASAYLEGAEIEQTFSLPFGIDLEAHGSYIYTHYDTYPQAFGQVGSPPFQYIPLFQFGMTPTWHVPIDPSWGELSASIAWSWYGHQSTSPLANEPLNYQPHYQNFDVRMDWTNVFRQPIDLAFFMTNVTDNLHVVGVIPLQTSAGFSSVAYNPPRMFGFTLKYRFDGAGEPETAPPAYVPPPVQAPAPTPRAYLVFFDFNKSDLTAQARDIVDTAAKNAETARVTQLTVTGHTDTVGSDAYNMRLSRRRAESVAAQLEKNGIAASEIEIVAKGKRDLLVPTRDGVREPQNRRVQIVFGGPTS
ncbi:MAG TPA: OmpA family protein [Alphaproteobacteria bacterium]|nr:OmpA family protein [Alphaproteobacteria bacterium]